MLYFGFKQTFSLFGSERAQKPILKDINFSVDPGKLTYIMGPSGAGKRSCPFGLVMC